MAKKTKILKGLSSRLNPSSFRSTRVNVETQRSINRFFNSPEPTMKRPKRKPSLFAPKTSKRPSARMVGPAPEGMLRPRRRAPERNFRSGMGGTKTPKTHTGGVTPLKGGSRKLGLNLKPRTKPIKRPSSTPVGGRVTRLVRPLINSSNPRNPIFKNSTSFRSGDFGPQKRRRKLPLIQAKFGGRKFRGSR